MTIASERRKMSIIDTLFGWLYIPESQMTATQHIFSVVGAIFVMLVLFTGIAAVGEIYTRAKERKKRRK